mgnify:FL=1
MNVIDRIAAVPTDMYDRPYEDVIIQTIRPVVAEPEVPEAADTTKTE